MSLEYQLLKACKHGNILEVDRLIDSKADIHTQNEEALRTAVIYNNLKIMNRLIGCGANIRVNNDFCVGYAAISNYIDIVNRLIECGTNIHAYYENILCETADFGHREMTYILLDNGADPKTALKHCEHHITRKRLKQFVEEYKMSKPMIKACRD
jgi:hypothetical protein